MSRETVSSQVSAVIQKAQLVGVLFIEACAGGGRDLQVPGREDQLRGGQGRLSRGSARQESRRD